MKELWQNAWNGWQNYILYGKYAALFLAAVFYLLLRRKREYPAGRLSVYGAVAGAACVFPPTAAVMMLYQTRFFDYEWIWSFVLVTALIALGGTCFLTDYWKNPKFGLKNICYDIALVGFVLGIILLCGNLGRGEEAFPRTPARSEEVSQVLDALRERCKEEELCLWAPREILEYARIEGKGVTLLYGRNMWDASLNAYSYDKYSEETEELYQWMEQFGKYGERDEERFTEDSAFYVKQAIDMGANCILLPADASTDGMAEWKMERLYGYYLIKAANYDE